MDKYGNIDTTELRYAISQKLDVDRIINWIIWGNVEGKYMPKRYSPLEIISEALLEIRNEKKEKQESNPF